jgi:anti-sigma factor RsiW
VSEATPPDIEDVRIEELLAARARGNATEAQTEELALYVEQRPELRARVEQAQQHGELGRGWLSRVEADHEVELAEQTPRVRLERGSGLGLLGLGAVLSFIMPFVGTPLLGLGTLVLLYSVARVRLRTHAIDPYKDVIR